jgi:hypothetical protein
MAIHTALLIKAARFQLLRSEIASREEPVRFNNEKLRI